MSLYLVQYSDQINSDTYHEPELQLQGAHKHQWHWQTNVIVQLELEETLTPSQHAKNVICQSLHSYYHATVKSWTVIPKF